MSRFVGFLRRLPLPAVALPFAVVAMTSAGAGLRPTLLAADLERWQAGDRVTVSAPASDRVAAAVLRRAATLEPVLGLWGAASRRVDVVDDRLAAVTVDEVDYRDANGRPLGLIRLAGDGRLLAAIRFDYRQAYAATVLAASQAEERARMLGAALALPVPAGPPEMRPTMDGLLWTILWTRVVDGTPVDGDGLVVRLWRSGDLHSVAVSERALAPPTTIMSPPEAQAILSELLPTVLSPERVADGTLTGPRLRWVAANDLFHSEHADAPAPVLRLAHVFEMRFSGPSAEVVRAVTLWIDAETGDLIGGDVLE